MMPGVGRGGWVRILHSCSMCLGHFPSHVFLRIRIIVHHVVRTKSSQQRAQEAFFFFQSQSRGSTSPFWGSQGCFYES